MHVTTAQILGLKTNIYYDHRYEGSKGRFDRNAAVYTIDFIIRMSIMFKPGNYEHYNFQYPSEACWNSIFTALTKPRKITVPLGSFFHLYRCLRTLP